MLEVDRHLGVVLVDLTHFLVDESLDEVQLLDRGLRRALNYFSYFEHGLVPVLEL